MNISPVSYNQNRTKAQQSKPSFGMIYVEYGYRPCINIMDVLATKFPIGTKMHSLHFFKPSTTEHIVTKFPEHHTRTKASIQGLSQAAEDLIAKVLKSSKLFKVEQTPHEPTKESRALLSMLKKLGVSNKEIGATIKTEEIIIE